jgi:hypothetical protein
MKNKLTITLNATRSKAPILEVSERFEAQLINSLKENTSIDLELLTCERTRFEAGGVKMTRYVFNNLSEGKLQEFEDFSKRLFIAMNNAINHAQN